MKLAVLGSTPETLPSQHGKVFLPESARATLQLLLDVKEVRRIVLFGSRAVGDHDDRSDFDVAISAPDLSNARLAFVRDAIEQSRTLYRISISLLEAMPIRLRTRVLLQGVSIYEREEIGRQPV